MFDEWACGFFAGSLAEWFTGIATFAAVLVALWSTFKAQQVRNHESAQRRADLRESEARIWAMHLPWLRAATHQLSKEFTHAEKLWRVDAPVLPRGESAWQKLESFKILDKPLPESWSHCLKNPAHLPRDVVVALGLATNAVESYRASLQNALFRMESSLKNVKGTETSWHGVIYRLTKRGAGAETPPEFALRAKHAVDRLLEQLGGKMVVDLVADAAAEETSQGESS